MGVKNYAQDYETPVNPGKMFQALVIDADSIIPQLLPDSVKKIEKEAGSIIITQLTNGQCYIYIYIYIYTYTYIYS